MEPIKPTPEIYRKAAKIIEDEGWIKGDYFQKSEGYCVIGAVRKACGFDVQGFANLPKSIVDPMADYVMSNTKQKMKSIPRFNDSRQSAKPVIKMLNDIANSLEKEQANA